MRSAKLVLMAILALSMTGIVACQSQEGGMSGSAVGDPGADPRTEPTEDPSGAQPGGEDPGSKPGSEQPGSKPGSEQPGGSEPGGETAGGTAIDAVVAKLNQTPEQTIDWSGIQDALTQADSAGGAEVAKALREAMTSPSAGTLTNAVTVAALMAGEKVTSADAASALDELSGALGDQAGSAGGGSESPADAVVILVVRKLGDSPDAMVDWRGIQSELSTADSASGAEVAKALRAVMISTAAQDMTSAETIKALMAGEAVKSSDAAAAIQEAAAGIAP